MALELTPPETDEAIRSLQKYFSAEGEPMGDLRAKLLLDFVLREIGPLAYNRGVQDSEAFLRQRLEDLAPTCFEPPFTYWQSKKRR